MNINLLSTSKIWKSILGNLLIFTLVLSLTGCTKVVGDLPNSELDKKVTLIVLDTLSDGDLDEKTQTIKASYMAVVTLNYTYLIYGSKFPYKAGQCVSNIDGSVRNFSILHYLEVTNLDLPQLNELARKQQIEFKKRNSTLYEPGGENYKLDSEWKKTEPKKE